MTPIFPLYKEELIEQLAKAMQAAFPDGRKPVVPFAYPAMGAEEVHVMFDRANDGALIVGTLKIEGTVGYTTVC